MDRICMPANPVHLSIPVFFEKNACNVKKNMILYKGCGMIAVKREVAAYISRFSVERMSS